VIDRHGGRIRSSVGPPDRHSPPVGAGPWGWHQGTAILLAARHYATPMDQLGAAWWNRWRRPWLVRRPAEQLSQLCLRSGTGLGALGIEAADWPAAPAGPGDQRADRRLERLLRGLPSNQQGRGFSALCSTIA